MAKKVNRPVKSTATSPPPISIPWYSTMSAKVGAAILFLAALFGMLNDGSSFMDRFSSEEEIAERNESTILDDIVINPKPLTIMYLHREGEFVFKDDELPSFEVESIGKDIIIEDSIKITNLELYSNLIVRTEQWNIPSIELVGSQIERKYINKSNPKSIVSLVLKINFFGSSDNAYLSDRSINRIGDITISVPYRFDDKVKSKEHKIPVLLEIPSYR